MQSPDSTLKPGADSGPRNRLPGTSALQTQGADVVRDVLRWAFSPVGPPPSGSLLDLQELLHPSAELLALLQRLTVVQCARLRWTSPPLGDRRPISQDALLLAAAMGVRNNGTQAAQLIAAIERPMGLAELTLRHGLVGPALPFLSQALADQLRRASPLSALLSHAVENQDSVQLQLCKTVMAHRSGWSTLVQALAEPSTDASVLRFRRRLMDRLRLDETGRRFVLDVYETALVLHREAHLSQVESSRELLNSVAAMDEAQTLHRVLAVAGWWQPLAMLDRSHREALRGRRALDRVYLRGIGLYREAIFLTGGSL